MPTGLILAALLAAAAPEPGPFVALGPADKPVTGRLVRLAADGTAELAAGAKTVTVRDAYSLHQRDVPRPPLPRGPLLVTTTGDRIPGRLLGGDGQALRFRPAFAPDEAEWKVPFSSAAVVWLTRPPADTPLDPGRYAWLADNRRRDVLLLRNGDTLRGSLDSFIDFASFFGLTIGGVKFKPESGDLRTIPTGQLAAVAFNPSLARTRKPKGPFVGLVLGDGTRLDVTGPTVDKDVLRGKALFGADVEVPLAEVVALDVFQGKATYLSDLKPAKAEQAGFLGPAWPWAADRSAHGGPLRLITAAGDATFDKGLGTHPKTTLVYTLGGKYRRFEAVVGLDPATGQHGRADVRVRLDGKEQDLAELRSLAAGPAVPVRLDVTGVKELTLVIDFGPTGDVQADVNWAGARVIAAGP
jgi:hypothetical protein